MEFSAWLLPWSIGLLTSLAVALYRRKSASNNHQRANDAKNKRTDRQVSDLVSREKLKARRTQLEVIKTLENEEQQLLSQEAEMAGLVDSQTRAAHQTSSQLQTIRDELKDLESTFNSLTRETEVTLTASNDVTKGFLPTLESIAQSPSDVLTEQLVENSKSNYLGRLETRKNILRENIENNGAQAARRILGLTLNRFDGVGHLERVSNQIEVPPTAFDILRDPSTDITRHICESLDVELWDKGGNTIGIRGENPLGREAARRTLTRLSQNWTNNSDRILRLCHRVNNQLNDEVLKAGHQALRTLQVKDVHSDIVALIGRLKFRLSYSQNQLLHAVEVAQIAGILAEELGLNVEHAIRGGLMHDIGKAMTHDHEGSHAVLGAEVARRCGELEVIANAIGSHHNDEPMNTPIAFIVTAADAISGARPGARRETASLYLSRMQQLSELAHSCGDGIERVDIMHAGREIRLAVPGSERLPGQKNRASRYDDASMIDLAENLAKTIEDEVVYPGQIRVTVIRESRSSAIAR